MYKFWLFLLISTLLFTSCNASKNTSNHVTTQQKLESQYQLYKGVKYKYGGTDKRGFDCSGFTQKVYSNAFNIQLPRTTEAMAQVGQKVSSKKLEPGDLVFFRPSRKYNHVGIFVGDDTFIHSSTSKGVIKSKMDNPYWSKKYKHAKRILNNKK
jgi:cell wall-associated NlpC family hydrolase